LQRQWSEELNEGHPGYGENQGRPRVRQERALVCQGVPLYGQAVTQAHGWRQFASDRAFCHGRAVDDYGSRI